LISIKLTNATVKDVHKAPPFELVGWFTLGSSSGPQPHILPIHTRISEVYTESPILLLFHPSDAQSEATAAGKLPLTLYESVFENATGGPNDKAMDIDGAAQTKTIKFKELAYSVETGEAEMIGVDFVARGGGNATAVNGAPAAAPKAEGSKAVEVKGKTKLGEKKEKQKEEAVIDETAVLTADDEESKFASMEVLIPSEAHRWQTLSVAERNELALQRRVWQPPQYFARLTRTF
jgi:COP9 signalosome complex subunit 6